MKVKFSFSAYSSILLFVLFLLTAACLQAQTYSVSGAGTADANGVYVKGGTYQDVGGDNSINDYYTKISGTSNPMVIYYYQLFWTILPSNSNQAVWEYYWQVAPNNGTACPTGSNWSNQGGGIGALANPTTSQNTTANMTFTNGSGYTPATLTPGTNNNPVGRFLLLGSSVGGVLQSLTISLTGTRSGVTAVKLWSSVDATFNSGSDVQLSSNTDAASITFNTFNSLVDNAAGTYYFITVDLAGGATGSVTPTIPSQASFSFAGANVPSIFTNAALTSGALTLPVELTSFTASAVNNSVTLNWATATEVNNYGFEVERRAVVSDQSAEKSVQWRRIGFVSGAGTSNRNLSYSYEDNTVSSGSYVYRLKQIDNDGTYKYSGESEVVIAVAKMFSLHQNYPNPFNPMTTIQFTLAEDSRVTLKVYDIMGRDVATLVNGELQAGKVQSVSFDASKLPSGIYFYRLEDGQRQQVQKLILMK